MVKTPSLEYFPMILNAEAKSIDTERRNHMPAA
jgi:hypothetical protein